MRLRGPDDVARFVRQGLDGHVPHQPEVLVLGLDQERRICGVALNDGRASLRDLTVNELVLLGEEFATEALVVVELLTGEPDVPSAGEVASFDGLAAECDRAGLILLDCLAVSSHRWWSFRELAGGSGDSGIGGCKGMEWSI